MNCDGHPDFGEIVKSTPILDPNAAMADGPRTYFGVDDIQAAVDHFIAAGCLIHEPVTETGDDIVVATVKRPNGQLLGLIYNPHFKEA